jgi:hypothetical protein
MLLLQVIVPNRPAGAEQVATTSPAGTNKTLHLVVSILTSTDSRVHQLSCASIAASSRQEGSARLCADRYMKLDTNRSRTFENR